MKLVDAATIRSVDSRAEKEFGIRGIQLMENAGRAVAEAVKRELPPGGRVSVLAGKGNNGGDGFVAARHLMNSGIRTSVFLLSEFDVLKGDSLDNAVSWRKMGGEVLTILSSRDLKAHEQALRHSSVIVDGIFGTGLSSPVAGIYAEVIGFVNGLGKKIVAIDVPSGIDSDTGAVMGEGVRADVTVTMAAPKIGLYVYPGRSYAGRVEVADIGAPRSLVDDESIRWELITGGRLRSFLKPRRIDAHKGSHGHLLVIAGSPGMTGAAYMAATAAMRAGAGLVTLAVPESLNSIMEVKTTEVMTLGLPETKDRALGPGSFDAVKSAMKGKSALLIGPGLGTYKGVSEFVGSVVSEIDVPVVIDADGLNAFSGSAGAIRGAKGNAVITPHPGEAARLLGKEVSEIQRDRVSAACLLSSATGAVVVLKGASTVVANPSGRVYINPTGNPGLATAGTGDILSGILGGLLAQGYSGEEAATSAAYIHGCAGDEVRKASGEAGMVATDLLPHIPALLNSLAGERGR